MFLFYFRISATVAVIDEVAQKTTNELHLEIFNLKRHLSENPTPVDLAITTAKLMVITINQSKLYFFFEKVSRVHKENIFLLELKGNEIGLKNSKFHLRPHNVSSKRVCKCICSRNFSLPITIKSFIFK